MGDGMGGGVDVRVDLISLSLGVVWGKDLGLG